MTLWDPSVALCKRFTEIYEKGRQGDWQGIKAPLLSQHKLTNYGLPSPLKRPQHNLYSSFIHPTHRVYILDLHSAHACVNADPNGSNIALRRESSNESGLRWCDKLFQLSTHHTVSFYECVK